VDLRTRSTNREDCAVGLGETRPVHLSPQRENSASHSSLVAITIATPQATLIEGQARPPSIDKLARTCGSFAIAQRPCTLTNLNVNRAGGSRREGDPPAPRVYTIRDRQRQPKGSIVSVQVWQAVAGIM
jgi:hypothetical protein